jgi:SAM-dependent methyltransferase
MPFADRRVAGRRAQSKTDVTLNGRSLKTVLYPETAAGGFTRVDGTIQFYTRVNALLEPDMTVVDLGAGRGAGVLDDPVRYRRQLRKIRGKVTRLIGIDVDPIVRDNTMIDEAIIVEPDRAWPVPDRSVDMVISDATFEHIADPALVGAECGRILKSGGWLCARTPNRWGYIALGSRLLPERLHEPLLKILQPHRKQHDIFPAHYRLNTPRSIRRHFPPGLWSHYMYTANAEPTYFGESAIAWRTMMMVFRLLPHSLGTTFMIFLQRK